HAQDGSGGVDTLINIQGVSGSSLGDTIIGGTNSEFFEGRGGNDLIVGGDGNGFDEIDFFNSSDGVTASLALQGNSQHISASEGDDIYIGIEGLDGSPQTDTLTGDAGNNFIQGREGDDSIDGGFADAHLLFGDWSDTILACAIVNWVDYKTANEGVTVD